MKTKLFLIMTIGLIFTLIPVISNAQNICFTQEDSKRLVVELERGRLLEKNLLLLEDQNKELIKQTEILKEQNKLLQEQFITCNDLLKKNEDLYKLKIKSLENDLDEAKKPRWGSMFSTFGLGAATGIITLLLFL